MSSGGGGGRESFDRVLDEFGSALWRLTSGYARTDADRKDLHQDILIAIWQALPRFEGKSSLRTFVYRIGHNRGISHRAHEARRNHGSIDDVVLRDSTPGPEARVEAARRSALLQTAVRGLAPPLKQPMMLHLEGLPNPEIAEIVGITEGNVAVRLTRARKAIRKALQTRGGS